jgi:hypothetical protein
MQEEQIEYTAPSQQLLDGIFNMIISAVHQMSAERSIPTDEARTIIASYLEKVSNGLRNNE